MIDKGTSIEICKLEDLLDYQEDLKKLEQINSKEGTKTNWIFRGQKNYGIDFPYHFTFISSLERAVLKFFGKGIDPEKIPEIEKALLREFERRLHHFMGNINPGNDDLEYLALMQHYGAPTRLLDWTYSFFVAAYFALEWTGSDIDQKDMECEVWALNTKYFNHRVKDTLNYKTPDKKQRAIIRHLMTKPGRMVYAVNPFKLNDRLAIQQGVLLFPGNISLPFQDDLSLFEQNLMSYPDKFKNNLVQFKIKVTPEERKKILAYFYRININRANLFPDLEGFGKSLGMRLAFPETLGIE